MEADALHEDATATCFRPIKQVWCAWSTDIHACIARLANSSTQTYSAKTWVDMNETHVYLAEALQNWKASAHKSILRNSYLVELSFSSACMGLLFYHSYYIHTKPLRDIYMCMHAGFTRACLCTAGSGQISVLLPRDSVRSIFEAAAAAAAVHDLVSHQSYSSTHSWVRCVRVKLKKQVSVCLGDYYASLVCPCLCMAVS